MRTKTDALNARSVLAMTKEWRGPLEETGSALVISPSNREGMHWLRYAGDRICLTEEHFEMISDYLKRIKENG